MASGQHCDWVWQDHVLSCHSEHTKIKIYLQWNSVITYPQGKWKRVRTNQSTFYPKRDFPHRQGPRVHATICHGRCFKSVLNVVHFSLFAQWNRLSGHRDLENVPGNWNRNWKVGWHARDQKKRTKERAKKCSSRENWYVISDFVPRSVRLIGKKCTCFPIGDVRDRRRESYNRVYILSRVRNNRVSLYFQKGIDFLNLLSVAACVSNEDLSMCFLQSLTSFSFFSCSYLVANSAVRKPASTSPPPSSSSSGFSTSSWLAWRLMVTLTVLFNSIHWARPFIEAHRWRHLIKRVRFERRHPTNAVEHHHTSSSTAFSVLSQLFPTLRCVPSCFACLFAVRVCVCMTIFGIFDPVHLLPIHTVTLNICFQHGTDFTRICWYNEIWRLKR